jgi:hypothetical protein
LTLYGRLVLRWRGQIACIDVAEQIMISRESTFVCDCGDANADETVPLDDEHKSPTPVTLADFLEVGTCAGAAG